MRYTVFGILFVKLISLTDLVLSLAVPKVHSQCYMNNTKACSVHRISDLINIKVAGSEDLGKMFKDGKNMD